MKDFWFTPDGSIHEMPREETQEERILAATRIVEEAQKTGIRIKDELVEPEQEYVDIDFPGLSRRDWFAGQAIPALVTRFEISDFRRLDSPFPASVAKVAYMIADAMLEARKK